MAVNPLGASIGTLPTQFVDRDLNLTMEARYFLLALLRRTGGQTGISTVALSGQIASLGVMEAMNDAAISSVAPQSFGLDIFSDSTVAPALNPILAALMVADTV